MTVSRFWLYSVSSIFVMGWVELMEIDELGIDGGLGEEERKK